ncbi:MobF family relaxase [Larkinella punicea]|uniref:Conjugal transfer protein n=1 Tax=Larkinella punicea TaxID=2315727 RepID=A0A368JKZ5_9BACT|nr:MobF family relaxase [Larkinella punicea]RCR68340.1 conjugal transfer protein [Larkinella punicea]
MIRMIQSSAAGQARRYFNSSLRQSDYYLNGQEQPGRLHGRIAARLGIQGPVTKNTFHALCEHINPITGKSLTPRKKDNRTVGYDINFHCPKSVSILHALTDESHILDAFQASVQQTMLDIERDAQTRVRKNGQDEDRLTGELVWADFIHQTARPVDGIVPDPHLHCHSFVFNVTWDAVENQFKAGQFRDIKRDMPYYQARFHKILSDKLISLGYCIRRTDTAFEIAGMPERIMDLFSKRTNEIGQIANELGITDASELDALGARTRAKKQKGLTMTQLKQAWRKQILAMGMNDKGEGDQPIRFAPVKEPPALTPKHCVEHALQLRFERASVMPDRRILETAYRHSIGNLSVKLDQITESFGRDHRILKIKDGAKTLCTTKEVLAEERRMVQLARQGQGTLQPLYKDAPPITLDGEQAEAVRHVLTTANRLSIIRGKAGTGKTTLMKEAIHRIERTGRAVTVVAPTAQAARGVLREEGFTEAETVAKLLASTDLQNRLKDGVLWVDEAGLLNTADMTALLRLVTSKNARLILSGDTRQHTSVVRGDALRILNTVAGIKSAETSRIFRQRDLDYRQAVQALSQGDVKTAFATLHKMGAMKTVDPANPFARLAVEYVTTLQRGKTALVISPTHHQGELVTQAIRDQLRQTGRIKKTESPALQLVNTNMTEAEKSDCRNYRTGQIIQFNQNVPGIERGSRWSVVSHTDTDVRIAAGSNRPISLPLDRTQQFDVYRQAEINLAKGDTIRITRNGLDNNRKRLNNGQILDVVAVDKNGTIRLRNRISQVNYTLPNSFGHLAYAHCITSHAAQGKTVDEVFIAQPASTFAATNLNQFYVSVSRARDAVHIYTDDPAALLATASKLGDRLSALELVQRKKENRKTAEHLVRVRPPVTTTLKTRREQEPVVKPVQRKPKPYAPRPTL